MHMFGGGQTNNPSMPPPGNNPVQAGYGPPADQEMGYGQNPNAAYGGPGGYGGPAGPGGPTPPTGLHTPPGQNPAYQGGYNNAGAPPGNYTPPGGGAAAPPGPPSYTRMSSTNPMNLIWFAAACAVMIGSLISCIELLLSLEWVDALEMAYLFCFGLLLAVLDTPLFNQVSIVSELRAAIGKYLAAVQRVTGKAAAYIFLGCALWSSMFSNLEGGFMLFMAALIGFFVTVIGAFSLGIAILKSRNLNLVRQELKKDNTSLKQMYDMHAKMNPTAGITQEEFKKMTPYARGIAFEQPDIKLIFNALSSHPRRDVISLDDLTDWVNGPAMVFI